ncbi:MAG: hypothetical protein LVQ75_02500 [Candidatus Babeliales bacterium]|jgi:hypothetical protein
MKLTGCNFEQQRRTQELLKHLTDNLAPLIALAAQTQQRALAAREDAAAAAEEVQPRRPIEFQPGVVLRTQQRGRGLADILHNEVYDNDDLQ